MQENILEKGSVPTKSEVNGTMHVLFPSLYGLSCINA